MKPLPVVHSLGLKTRRLLAGSPLDLRYIAVDASGLRQGREFAALPHARRGCMFAYPVVTHTPDM